MKKFIFFTYAKKFLEGIINGNEILENPAVDFTVRAKAGEFDKISDIEYNELLAYCEDANSIWKKQTKGTAAQLLANVMHVAKADKETFIYMADPLDEAQYEKAKEEKKEPIPSEIFTNYVARFIEGIADGNKLLRNPKNKMIDQEKIGELNDIDGEEYGRLVAHCEMASRFWRGKGAENSARLLKNAMKFCKITNTVLFDTVQALDDSYYFKIGELETAPEEEWDCELDENDMLIEKESFSNVVKNFYGKDIETYTDYIMILQNKYDGIWLRREARDSTRENDYIEFNYFERILNEKRDLKTWRPKEIYDYVHNQIYGQEEAVKAASMLVYNHIRGHKRNVLFLGPTGCGKTEIWRVLGKLYKNIRIIDSTRITQEGWKGEYKFQNVFDGIEEDTAENMILVFDEFDKMCEPMYGSNGSNYSTAIQNELLKFMEGTDIECKDDKEKAKIKMINTSKISFVFCGSFESMMVKKNEGSRSLGFGVDIEKKSAFAQYQEKITPEDLAANGNVRREVCGRINQIVQLKELSTEDYEHMMNVKTMSPLAALEREYSVKLSLDQETKSRIAKMAAENKMGVRYIYSTLQQLLDEEVFKEDGKEEYSLSMGE